MTRKEILKLAVDTYGQEAQMDMMIEEMSELTKALLKYRRGPSETRFVNILEEMADVQIMLDQMKIIFADPIGEQEFKLQRLLKRLEGHAEEGSDTDAIG